MNYLKHLYQKILAASDSYWAPYVLGVASFTESCCFIIPPEVLLLPMSYANRKKALWYALITTLTSVLGAVAGYYIGHFLWTELQDFIFNYLPGFQKYFEQVGEKYQENVITALFLAAFTPIPFKVFTVAAGVYSAKISILTLVVVSFFGRGLRYSLLAGLIMIFGAKVHDLIEKHFAKMTLLGGVLLAILVYLLKVYKT